jgi:hypothetical protein
MRNSMLALAAIAGLLSACQTKTPEEKIDSLASTPDTTLNTNKACYAYISNKDTVSLSLVKAGTNISGELDYNYFEKDKNTGTMAGLIKGDTIFADYTFRSEGATSVREVVFLKKGDQLIEGYAEMKEEGGKSIFTDTRNLKFDGKMPLSAINCK